MSIRPKIAPHSFLRNVLTLIFGTSIAQIIPIIASPLLTRLYTPEDFGVFAVFLALATMLASVANLRYELAIMLPEGDDEAFALCVLGFLISTFVSILSLLPIIAFNEGISRLLGNRDIARWLYLIPIYIFLSGLFNVLSYYNSRNKRYKDLAFANIAKSFFLVILQLGYTLFANGPGGLIIGQTFSVGASNAKLLRNALQNKNNKNLFSLAGLRRLAVRYKNFPLYSMPAIFANTLSNNIVSLLISSFYSISILGQYALVQRVMGMPMSLLGTSISQVYFQQATSEKNLTGTAANTFSYTLKKLFFFGTPLFIGFYFLAEPLFSFIFGEEWRSAGHYASILAPLFWSRFIVTTLSITNSIFEKQKLSLAWQFGLLILSSAIITVSYYSDSSFNTFLWLFSISISVYYLILLLILYRVSRGLL